jgi:hypothetical protein
VSYRGKFCLIPCRDEFYVSVIDGYKVYVVPCRRTVYSPCHRPGKVTEGWKNVMKTEDRLSGGSCQRLKMRMLEAKVVVDGESENSNFEGTKILMRVSRG